MRSLTSLFAALLLVGCAQSGGVLPMGPDTYSTSAAAAPARGGWSEARRLALTEANQHCASLGKEILVMDVSTATTNLYGAGSASVTFRCLSPGDPELVRPDIRRVPDAVIEDRRN
jgi:hypothetical protein